MEEDTSKVASVTSDIQRSMKDFGQNLPQYGRDFFFDRQTDLLHKYYRTEDATITQLCEVGNAVWDRITILPRGFCHGDYGLHNMLKIQSPIEQMKFVKLVALWID